MKCFNKILIFSLFMLSNYEKVVAHTYSITNLTGGDVKVMSRDFGNNKLHESEKLLKPYEKYKFSAAGLFSCLEKIFVTSFNKEKGAWIKLSAPFRIVEDDQFSNVMKKAIKLNKLLQETGEKLAIVYLEEMAITQQMVAGLVEAIEGIAAINFCRDVDFILVTDYDPLVRLNRVYALTSPKK